MQRPHWWCLRIPGIDPSLAPHQAQSERDDDPQAAFPALQEVPPSFSVSLSRLVFSPFFLVVSFVFFFMPPSLLFSSIPPCLCLCGERWGQLLRRSGKVLLSTARPTSPINDQTKGRVGRVYRDTEVRCRERKIRSDEDTALIQIESSSPTNLPTAVSSPLG